MVARLIGRDKAPRDLVSQLSRPDETERAAERIVGANLDQYQVKRMVRATKQAILPNEDALIEKPESEDLDSDLENFSHQMRFLESQRQDQGAQPAAEVANKPPVTLKNPTKTVVTQRLYNKLTGGPHRPAGEAFEDCMACRMVWKQVEMDVANAKYPEDVQQAFTRNCAEAQKTEIFYRAVSN